MHNSQENEQSDKKEEEQLKFKFEPIDGKEFQIKELSNSEESESVIEEAEVKKVKTMGDLFNKYVKEEVEFIDGISISDDVKSKSFTSFQKFLLIEKLAEKFSLIDLTAIKNAVSKILQEKERQEISLNFIGRKREKQLKDKIREMQEKESPALEKAKVQFNKVTVDTVKQFAGELMKIKLENMHEMMDLCSFVFTKVIEEKCFLAAYTNLIKILKNDFMYKDEEDLKRDQTCFFGVLLKLMTAQVKRDHNFNKEIEVKTEGKSEGAVEAEIENLELERKTKRIRSMGSLDFCISLYKNQVTGIANLRDLTKFLLQKKSSEHLEMLCRILKEAGSLLSSKNSDLVNEILTYVKESSGYGPRMEIIVEQALDEFNKRKRPENSKNLFKSFKSPQEKPKEKEKTERQEVEQFFEEHLSIEIASLYTDDLDEAVSTVKEGLKKFSHNLFYLIFFLYSITSKNSKKFIILYLDHLSQEIPCKNLFSVLETLRQELFSLYVDYPSSQRKYPELLCYLRANQLINPQEFNNLKVSDFEKKVGDLIDTWLKENYENIENVYTKEEIDKYFRSDQ